MSQRASKKLRQQYRRQFAAIVQQQVNEAPNILATHIKPKPSWMPSMVYHWCMRVVLK